ILCAARPSLDERRPEWGKGRGFYSRLDLSPLSKGDSRHLVEEILQRVEEVPALLRELVVRGAECNPFFVEELIKMLIEEGVIRKGETAWSVDADRLGDLQVPPTLTGVLQARLDRLPFDQRQVLQEASVVGRLFWDLAVAYIAAESEGEAHSEEVTRALDALQGREMVFPGATSAIEGAHEYLFKHALLREVTYEGVLKRVRRVYHGLVADWMMAQAGEREREYTGLLADHLALAGRTEEAAVYLRRAAEQAAAAYANAEAASYYTRALELTPADQAEARYEMLLAREGLHELLGATEERGQDVAALEALAEELDRAQGQAGRSRRAEVALRRAAYERWSGNNEPAFAAERAALRLAHQAQDVAVEAEARRVRGGVLNHEGKYREARQQFERALALARQCGTRRVEAGSLSGLGWVLWHSDPGDSSATLTALASFWEDALELYRQSGYRRGEAETLNDLGYLFYGWGDLPRASTYYERARDIYREIGDRLGEAGVLAHLGWLYRGQDNSAGGWDLIEQAAAIRKELGGPLGEALSQGTIGNILTGQGLYTQGEDRLRQAVRAFREAGDRRQEGFALLHLGRIRYLQGDYAQARTFLEDSCQLLRQQGSLYQVGTSLALLSLVSHAQGDDETARDFAQRALENGPHDYPVGVGQSALALGHALSGLGDRAGAIAAYRQALDQYRQSGLVNRPMEALAGLARGLVNRPMEPLAGLARVFLGQGDTAQALEQVEAILDHLQSHTLDGTHDPFRIQLTCYRVLEASDDPRAGEVLRAAYHLLQERAAMFEDERLHRSFLEAVPWHRELVQESVRAGLGGHRSEPTD
ncbi:MAG: tetratricopeptide repeat protein, partial [Anaerolineae bacterium]